MSRPIIVRADTIDLQDQENPTAADHQKHPDQDSLAPHQASQLHHVIQERRSEENSLADAWNIASTLTEEPGATDGQQTNGDRDHATNGSQREGGENGENGEGAESEGEGDEDMMDRISSSPSIEDEDIDFEFVYALHTFVATVEGQANATKGDTMVLLDDSNSYWWLVRVVKDSSIGYLPAEHIETPTERLARLNKHRNIDLSATMLSDNSEKTRNPLKKLRRRNAKTVQFAAPTYVEASDYDYSTEDEDTAMIDPYGTAAATTEEPQQTGHDPEPEKDVAESDAHADGDGSGTPTRGSFDREQAATAAVTPSIDEPQLSPKLVDKTEAAPLKSRKGTPRNTDSFLKDDSIETKKISLTPGILREDSTSTKSLSMDSSRSGSAENLVKQVSPPDQQSGKKDSKDKKKEKVKGGMLSGLFKSKKKDKKVKDDGMESDAEKPSTEIMRSESPRLRSNHSGTSSPVESVGHSQLVGGDNRQSAMLQQRPVQAPASAAASAQAPTQAANRGKLQKQQPPSNSNSPVREPAKEQSSNAYVAELEGSGAAHEMATDQESAPIREPGRTIDTQAAAKSKDKEGPLSPIVNLLRSNSEKDPKPTKAKRAKQRVELDDFDSPTDEEGPNPFQEREERVRGSEDTEGRERLSESPIEIMPGTFTPSTLLHDTFMHGTESIHIPTPGSEERRLQDEEPAQEPESLSSSPSIIEKSAEPHEDGEEGDVTEDDPTPTAPRSPLPPANVKPTDRRSETPDRGLSTDSSDSSALLTPNAPSTPSALSQQPWSDSSLRAWYDDGSEIKDMLMMIHDKSGVVPVSADHPMMAGLFVEQRKGVEKMMGDLDGLLGSYLQRKGITLT